jgi:hypothetical protein
LSIHGDSKGEFCAQAESLEQFTYHSQDGVNDEQDIEMLGRTLFATGADGTPPGIELTNYDVRERTSEIVCYH